MTTRAVEGKKPARVHDSLGGKDRGLNKLLPLAPCYSCTVRFLSIFFFPCLRAALLAAYVRSAPAAKERNGSSPVQLLFHFRLHEAMRRVELR
jgi:hypothetical protein